jgi:hypothetical protein
VQGEKLARLCSVDLTDVPLDSSYLYAISVITLQHRIGIETHGGLRADDASGDYAKQTKQNSDANDLNPHRTLYKQWIDTQIPKQQHKTDVNHDESSPKVEFHQSEASDEGDSASSRNPQPNGNALRFNRFCLLGRAWNLGVVRIPL